MGLTGQFPYKSSRRNEYILFVYHVDFDTISGTAIKNRQVGTLTQAWIKLENIFSNCNTSTNIWILDNESSFEQNTMRKKILLIKRFLVITIEQTFIASNSSF